MIVANIIYSLICLKGKKFFKILWSIILVLIFVAVSFIVFPIFSFLINKPIKDIVISGDVNRILVVLVVKMFQWIISWLIISSKGNVIVNNKSEKLLILLLLVANTIIQFEFLVLNYNYQFSGREQVQLLLVCGMIMIVFLCCIFMIIKISNKNAKIMENELLKVEIDAQKQMVLEIGKREELIRIERHDLKHYVNIWHNLIMQNNYERAKDEMNKYITKLDNIGSTGRIIKENDLINAVLYQKISECQSKGIECKCECMTTFAKERETDIAIVLSNLLDNAIRAEEELKQAEKCITIKLSVDSAGNAIIISNNINKSVLEQNPSLKTTKQEKKLHGIGLRSVKEVVEKYSATIDIKEKDNKFIVLIMGL